MPAPCIGCKGMDANTVICGEMLNPPAEVGTKDIVSLHFVSFLAVVLWCNPAHNALLPHAAVQLHVKEILASWGSEETYTPIKIPL